MSVLCCQEEGDARWGGVPHTLQLAALCCQEDVKALSSRGVEHALLGPPLEESHYAIRMALSSSRAQRNAGGLYALQAEVAPQQSPDPPCLPRHGG